MKKIVQTTVTVLMVTFLSIGFITRAQGPQGGTDTGGPNCRPPRVCKPENPVSPAPTPSPQVGTIAPDGQTTSGVFFDLLLLFIRLKLMV
jgi:hypothetical protein